MSDTVCHPGRGEPASGERNAGCHRKIVPAATLARTLAALRRTGRSVVQCHGCFDLVHPGHVRYLRFARSLGDVLVVSLTGDSMVDKGPDRPYIPQELRAENLAALEFVDWVVIDPHPTACELLQLLKPDIYVKGREYAACTDPRFLREREIVEGYGGRVVFHSGDVVFSSTQLIRTLGDEPYLDACRLRTLCQRNRITSTALRRALEGFADLLVIVVGDVLRETYILCDARDPASETPAPSLEKLGQRSYWGGAAALVLQLHALGARPRLFTTGGNDAASHALQTDMERIGVEVDLVPVRSSLPQRETFVADDVKLFHVTQAAGCPLDSRCEQELAQRLAGRLRGAALLMWCDYGCGCIGPGLVRGVTPLAREAGVPVAATFGPGGDVETLAGTDLFVVTERLLRAALHDTADSLPSVVWRLLERTQGRAALVGLHKNGYLLFDGGSRGPDHPVDDSYTAAAAPPRLRSEFVPALTDRFVDLQGVIELVAAAAGLAWARGAGAGLTTYLAAAIEALAASRPRRSRVTLGELDAWLRRRPELVPESRFRPDPEPVPEPEAQSETSVTAVSCPSNVRSP